MNYIIKIKRVYESCDKGDGYRIFIDRLWPRGIKKESLVMNDWIKDLAPSVDLRKWFNHESKKFTTFRKKYILELNKSDTVSNFLITAKKHKTITLLYAAANEQINHALVLQEFINKKINKIIID